MNVNHTRRVRVAIVTLWLLAAVNGNCRAQGLLAEEENTNAKKQPARVFPRSLIAPSTLDAAEIRWRNGEVLTGELAGADHEHIMWKTELFTEPMRLQEEVIERLDFAKLKPKANARDAFRAVFMDGSHLTGSLADISAETVSISNESLETTMNFKAEQLVSLERIKGAGLVESGPIALLAGKAPNADSGRSSRSGRLNRSAPYLAAAGRIVALAFNGGVRQELEIPEKCLIHIGFRSPDSLKFALSARTGEDWVKVETWGDELVLMQGDRFVSAGVFGESEEAEKSDRAEEIEDVKEAEGAADLDSADESGARDREVNLRLGWDRDAKRVALYASDGTLLAELSAPGEGKPGDVEQAETAKDDVEKNGDEGDAAENVEEVVEGIIDVDLLDEGLEVDPFAGMDDDPFNSMPQLAKADPPGEGIVIVNKGAGLLIERYSVSNWTGQAVGAIENGTTVTVETESETLRGNPQSLTDETLTVQLAEGESREVAIASVRAIRWPRTAELERDPDAAEFWFANGNLLRGELAGISDGNALMRTSFSDQPVLISLAQARALALPAPAQDEPVVGWQPLNTLDVIASGELTLHGTLEANGEKLPRFRPVGAEQPLMPASSEFALTRARPADDRILRAPALLYVANAHTGVGESWPIELKEIQKQSIAFEWAATETRALEVEKVHAVQLSIPEMGSDGFGISGWRVLSRRKENFDRKDGTVTLPPDRSIGNPYLLNGSNFSFKLTPKSGLSSIRIRLFCQGTASDSDSMNFLIAHYGSQIYFGHESEFPGQFENQMSISAQSNSPANIDFSFKGDAVELSVNDVKGEPASIKEHKGKKIGAGVIVETVSVWGNRIGPAVLSDFATRNSLSLPPPPAFSEDARQEALLLPRLRRDLPPRHVLIGKNGDLLRGEIETMAAGHLLFRLGLETVKVPMDRLSAIVWVDKPDETELTEAAGATDTGNQLASQNDAPESAPVESETAPKSGPGTAPAPGEDKETQWQWLDLVNGGRIGLEVESWTAESVTGNHPMLGRCVLPSQLVHHLTLKKPEPAGAIAALADWKFKKTADPVFPGGETAEDSPLVGKPAEDFSLPTVQGDEFTLSKHKGKVVVLDFWATWCAPCARSLPLLIQAMAKYPSDKLVFVAVNKGEPKELAQRFFETRGLLATVALDTNMATSAKYGADAIPYTVVIDPKGMVTSVTTGAGANSEQRITDAVTNALADADVPGKDVDATDTDL